MLHREFLSSYVDVLDVSTTSNLLATYGRLDELQHYAGLRGDYETLLDLIMAPPGGAVRWGGKGRGRVIMWGAGRKEEAGGIKWGGDGRVPIRWGWGRERGMGGGGAKVGGGREGRGPIRCVGRSGEG